MPVSAATLKNYQWQRRPFTAVIRVAVIAFAAALMAFDINTFVHAGHLFPGGFTGVVLLAQEIARQYFNYSLPFSPLYYLFNAIPAVLCYFFIGRWFTLYSVLMIFLTGIFTDLLPPMFIEHIVINDTLLSAVFGGVLWAFSVALTLYVGATSGGSDFIAIYLAEKYRRDAWNYIFFGNCVILAIAGSLFSWNHALYSIIFQFVFTHTLSAIYRGYQQKTLLIITQYPQDIYELIREFTNHGATLFKGVGMYQGTECSLVYSVVTADEVEVLIESIRELDKKAFINILRTEQIKGNFFYKPKD